MDGPGGLLVFEVRVRLVKRQHFLWRRLFDQHAPRFDENGKKTANAKFVKVVHNGVVIHEDVEVKGPTTAALGGPEKPRGPLMLQGDHGPVAYRKIKISLK